MVGVEIFMVNCWAAAGAGATLPDAAARNATNAATAARRGDA